MCVCVCEHVLVLIHGVSNENRVKKNGEYSHIQRKLLLLFFNILFMYVMTYSYRKYEYSNLV